jgi:hypothetical protein
MFPGFLPLPRASGIKTESLEPFGALRWGVIVVNLAMDVFGQACEPVSPKLTLR